MSKMSPWAGPQIGLSFMKDVWTLLGIGSVAWVHLMPELKAERIVVLWKSGGS